MGTRLSELFWSGRSGVQSNREDRGLSGGGHDRVLRTRAGFDLIFEWDISEKNGSPCFTELTEAKTFIWYTPCDDLLVVRPHPQLCELFTPQHLWNPTSLSTSVNYGSIRHFVSVFFDECCGYRIIRFDIVSAATRSMSKMERRDL